MKVIYNVLPVFRIWYLWFLCIDAHIKFCICIIVHCLSCARFSFLCVLFWVWFFIQSWATEIQNVVEKGSSRRNRTSHFLFVPNILIWMIIKPKTHWLFYSLDVSHFFWSQLLSFVSFLFLPFFLICFKCKLSFALTQTIMFSFPQFYSISV